MKKGNLFLLGLGYVAGLLVALKFSKDGKDKDLSALAEDIKSVHKNLWTDAENRIFSEENREKISLLKVKALKEIEAFKKEAAKELALLKKKGNVKKEEIVKDLEKLYQNRQEIIDTLVEDGTKIAEEVMETSEEVGTKISKKVVTLAKDLKKQLESTYKDIKKKLK